ncbi:biopolymer transport protein ExbD/TolR [Psychromonas sp. CNPT3]|uniref:protein TolR n=1 Tax=Psychromonas sp. CNPT3 TaxID=314282 RepID=UPI00006E483C|nr:protein TolR [Psychromonas sp. CNPT3]AGH81812.1 biopolymer transport protein ExbD/TolR [Psychromonas sp. CNPT3]
MQYPYRKTRRRIVSEINVVPYIDVMLVLLIIFMATATSVTLGVKVDLPQATSQPLPVDTKPPLIASIDKQGLYYLSTGASADSPLNEDELQALVRLEIRRDANAQFVVKGDGAVPYKKVIDLMVLLQTSGVESIGLMTEPDNEK